MTREEAIERLNNAKECPLLYDSHVEAIEMAISSLEQEPVMQTGKPGSEYIFNPAEPCDDAISIRKDALKTRVGNIVAYNVDWLKEHWQMEMDIVCGVKPCGDAISREAVIKLFNGNIGSEAALILHKAKKLPSVTQKSGKWIYKNLKGQYCSVCDEQSVWKFNFCPNCGACMKDGRTLDEFIEDMRGTNG